MTTDFHTYTFSIDKVLPTIDTLTEYLHIDDVQHPAYLFAVKKLKELNESGFESIGGYTICDVESINTAEGTVTINGQTIETAPQVSRYMRGSSMMALFCCTAGNVFSMQSEVYNDKGDYLEGFITDAIGSLTVENAMQKIQDELEKDMEGRGLKITNRYSPGYCNWPLKGQKVLFSIIGNNPTGISLTDTCLMQPIKSVSGIIGIGADVKKRAYGCPICKNKECIYRKIINHKK
jgi:hypothetical protein